MACIFLSSKFNMKYSFHYVVIVIFLSVFCDKSLNFVNSNSHAERKLLPRLDKLSLEKESGVLHTLRRYAEWNFKEEKLVKMFKLRAQHLQKESGFLKCFSFSNKTQLQRMFKVIFSIRKLPPYNIQLFFLELGFFQTQISKNKWVGAEDLLFSMTGIHHLQDVYYTPANQISKGLTFDTNFGGLFSQLEMVLQALYSLSQNRLVTAISWLQEAATVKKEKLSSDLLHSFLYIGIQAHNLKYLIRDSTTEQYTNIRTDVIEDVYQVPILNGQLPPNQYSNRVVHFNKYGDIDLHTRFTYLCKGHNLQSPKVLSSLRCYIDNRRHPFLYINPVKVEQLSLKPLILQYYEIMSNKTIEATVNEVGPHVTPLKLWYDDDNFAYGSVPLSVTNSGNMGINFGKVSKATQKLTEILSGLTVWEGPNHNRYREHVYGRHLNMHNDGVDITHKLETQRLPNDEDIIGTMLFYLKVPTVGGCTAFVHTGVCSREVPGSATFWYNMYKNGSYTTELRHGSCPVYHGEKIAITLFIKHNANWNKRLCSTDQFSTSI